MEKEPDIQKLVKELDGLPLALATAGTYLSLESVSVTEYLEHYRQSWLDLQQTSPELLSYEDRTLYSTWNLSYNHIRQQDEDVANLLQLWAYFDNQDLWYELLALKTNDTPSWLLRITRSKVAFNAAMRKLCDHALIHSWMTSGGYGMHHCVHTWTAHVLNDRMEDSRINLALNCVGCTVPVTPEAGDSVLQQRLLPHANRCMYLLSIKSQFEAAPSIMISYDLGAFHNLGVLYSDQGKLAEAEEMYVRALKGKEKAWGPDHMSTLDTVNNLGVLYNNQGKLAEAEKMYVRALKGYEKAWGPDHMSTLDTVNNLGNLYLDQGKLAEAEEIYVRALKGMEKAIGLVHKSTSDTAYNLANLYQQRGMFEASMRLFQQAESGYRVTLGPQHADTVDAVARIARIRKTQKT